MQIPVGLTSLIYELISNLMQYCSSPELMKNPALDFDTKELGPLLENNEIDELQNQ